MSLYAVFDKPDPTTPAATPIANTDTPTISGESSKTIATPISTPVWSTPTFVPPPKRKQPPKRNSLFGLAAFAQQVEGSAIIRAAPQSMNNLISNPTSTITKVSIQAPSMTLEEDVNGFGSTAQGKKLNKKRKKSGGFGKGRREDAELAFDETEYDPTKPCDYAAYKIHVEVVRTQRRLNREEEERRGDDSDSYEDSEAEVVDPTKKKPRFFAPPSSYDAPPTNPDGTPIIEESMNPISAPRTETGEEAYLRRLAMSGQNPRPHSPPPESISTPTATISFEPASSTSNSVVPRAFPSFAPATSVSSIGPQLPSSGLSFVRPAASSFYAEEAVALPPPTTFSAPPVSYSAPPISYSAPPVSYSAPPSFIAQSNSFVPSTVPPPPLGFTPPSFASTSFIPPSFVPSAPIASTSADPRISEAAMKAKEIAARLSKLAAFQPASVEKVIIPVDDRPFAERFMTAHGWEAGQGIGAASDGRAEALTVTKAALPSKKFKGKNKNMEVEVGLNAAGKGRGKIFDSTREDRLKEDVEKFGAQSRIIVLTNMVNIEEVDEELIQEVTSECNLIGVCERAFTILVEGEVRIFVVMSGLAGGFNCRSKFDGRWFGGRQVKARFYDETAFSVDFEQALELDPNSPAKEELEVARRQVTRRIVN